MAMTKCKECGKDVSDKAATCPNCGIADPAPSPKSRNVDMLVIGALITFVYFYFFYDGDESGPSVASQKPGVVALEPWNCSQGTKTSEQYYVGASNVNFRTEPSVQSDRVLNKTATQVLGTPQYRTLSLNMVLQGLCETDEWLLGDLVEADGEAVDWERGWVHKKFITKSPSEDYLAGLMWDIQNDEAFTSEEKAILRKGALKVLADEPACSRVITGFESSKKVGSYFVTCAGEDGAVPFNVWFTPEQLVRGDSLALPQAHPEDLSRLTCIEMIKQFVTHPSTLDIHDVYGYSSFVHSNRSRTVRQSFSAKNSFNLKLDFTAYCVFQPDGELDFSVNEVR